MSSYPNGQSTMSAPSIGPSSARAWKSTSRKRGSLPSAWKPPPPTVDGRLFTSPVQRRSPPAPGGRYVRGSSSGSGPRNQRVVNLISSLLTWPSGPNGGSSARRWLRPFSSTITDQPASASTCAAVAPPGPEPITTTSASRSGTTADLGVGVAARLHVAVEPDRPPTRNVAVAAVLGCAVARLTRVLVEQVLERRIGVEATVLLVAVLAGEVAAQRGEPVAVPLLPTDDRAVELALGAALRTLDARAPRDRLDP